MEVDIVDNKCYNCTGMNFQLYTSPNAKGQIVIPKAIRTALSIDERVMLCIKLAGNSIHITPVTGYISPEEVESSYIDLLKKTRGSWGINAEKDQEKSLIERHASSRRKHPW